MTTALPLDQRPRDLFASYLFLARDDDEAARVMTWPHGPGVPSRRARRTYGVAPTGLPHVRVGRDMPFLQLVLAEELALGVEVDILDAMVPAPGGLVDRLTRYAIGVGRVFPAMQSWLAGASAADLERVSRLLGGGGDDGADVAQPFLTAELCAAADLARQGERRGLRLYR